MVASEVSLKRCPSFVDGSVPYHDIMIPNRPPPALNQLQRITKHDVYDAASSEYDVDDANRRDPE